MFGKLDTHFILEGLSEKEIRKLADISLGEDAIIGLSIEQIIVLLVKIND